MDAGTFYRWLFSFLFFTMWGGFFTLWRVMALRAKAAAEAESRAQRLSHLIPMLLVAFLLIAPLPGLLAQRFVPLALWPATLGAGLTAAGIAFTCWARLTLAGNWSGDIQLKQNHELILAGPYRWVRHPIYTGLLVAFIGTALAIGEARALVAVAIAAAAFWRKLRREEAVMRREFGDAYDRYAARVPALVPFLV